MPLLTVGERLELTALKLASARRRRLADLLSSPMLRWRYGTTFAGELLFVPQDLRTADPSFASEVEFGHFGLSGAVAFIGSRSPFEIEPPSVAWGAELAGFGWLRHLRAAGHARAKALALGLVLSWIGRQPPKHSLAWHPDVLGRRLMSWLANASLLLEDVEEASYDRITDSLGEQLIALSATWRCAADGYPRLLALIALTMADLCIAGHDRNLESAERRLAEELDRQVLPDGGHRSRNPAVLVELLLDLLPLRQCFVARGRKVPSAVDAAIARIHPMLRYLRLGDGSLSRFNGVAGHTNDALATVFAYEEAPGRNLATAPQSHYVRLERGPSVVIVDAGPPPPLALAGCAHAGCLSFEMSAGACAMFVNGGAPGPANQDWSATARSTASHNTLAVDGKSSSRLVQHPDLERLIGAPPIRMPDGVVAVTSEKAGALEIDAHHNGYLRRYRLLHRRRLSLSLDGSRLDGLDRLGPTRGHLRLARDVPFAIHFHLHTDVDCHVAADGGAIRLALADGSHWLLSAEGATATIEESIRFADIAGPIQALQITLRAACPGESEIAWSVSKE